MRISRQLLSLYSYLNQLNISSKIDCFSYKDELVCIVLVLIHLKEELAWATDKCLELLVI